MVNNFYRAKLEEIRKILDSIDNIENESILDFCSNYFLEHSKEKVELNVLVKLFRKNNNVYISSKQFAQTLRFAGYKVKKANANKTYVYKEV